MCCEGVMLVFWAFLNIKDDPESSVYVKTSLVVH